MVSSITIGNCLKDLMAIQCPRVDNSELLDRIDRVSNSIAGCINLAKSALRKRKSSVSYKKTNPQIEHTCNIFSGLDHIDKKITQCIKLAEDTLNANGLDDQEYPEFVNPWASSQSDFEQDQAFIDYLDELDGSISEDKLWKNRQN